MSIKPPQPVYSRTEPHRKTIEEAYVKAFTQIPWNFYNPEIVGAEKRIFRQAFDKHTTKCLVGRASIGKAIDKLLSAISRLSSAFQNLFLTDEERLIRNLIINPENDTNAVLKYVNEIVNNNKLYTIAITARPEMAGVLNGVSMIQNQKRGDS